jgi:hypothetical protein
MAQMLPLRTRLMAMATSTFRVGLEWAVNGSTFIYVDVTVR